MRSSTTGGFTVEPVSHPVTIDEDVSAHRQSVLGLVKGGLMVAALRLVRQRLKQRDTARDE